MPVGPPLRASESSKMERAPAYAKISNNETSYCTECPSNEVDVTL